MTKLRAVECREFIKAVIEKADDMGVPVSIAVVGPEGHLIALERMDEAGFITPDTAIAKAYTVAAFRSMSPRFPDGLVIPQWFKERNPQLLIRRAAMTNGKIAASGGDLAIGHGGETDQQLRIALLEPLLEHQPVGEARAHRAERGHGVGLGDGRI